MKHPITNTQSPPNTPQSQPPQAPPPWLGFLLLVIGVPTGVVTQNIAHNPTLTVIIVVAYYVCIGMSRLVIVLVQPVGGKLATASSNHLSTRIEEFLNHYEPTYRNALIEECKILSNEDRSINPVHALNLEPIFVDLRIIPKHASDAAKGLLPSEGFQSQPLQAHQEQGSHSIWEYLSGSIPTKQHLVVLGVPGSGKTTLLKYLTLVLAQPKKYRRYHDEAQLKQYTFPIRLSIGAHAHSIAQSNINNSPFTIAHAVQEHMKKRQEGVFQDTAFVEWINRQLKSNRCLIMLDGLDEVADTTLREEVVDWVKYQMWVYGNNKFILTSRRDGYLDNQLGEVSVSHFEVQHFTPEQVALFIHNWYLENEQNNSAKGDRSVNERAKERAKDLLQRLWQKPALLDLTVNPLLLDMVATVHQANRELPEKRVELYAEICKVFLNRRSKMEDATRGPRLTDKQKIQVLQPLANYMMEKGVVVVSSQDAQREIAGSLALINPQMTPENFLQIINKSSLLIEPEPATYKFAHKTFQEYLVSVYIKEKELEQTLIDRVPNSWWHETIRLYCAQADASRIIQTCLRGDPPTIETLVLACECDDDKKEELQPQVQALLNRVLEQGVEDPDSERRRVIAEALLKRRTQRMIHLYDEIYLDVSLVTCAEYQLFLNEQVVQQKYHQPDQWLSLSFPDGKGNDPVLGIRHSDADAFCKWLTKRDREQWYYRLPHAIEQPHLHVGRRYKMSMDTGHWSDEPPFFCWYQGREPNTLDAQRSNARLAGYINFLNVDDFILRARDIDESIRYILNHRRIDDISRELRVIDIAHERGFTPFTENDLKGTLDRALLSDRKSKIEFVSPLISHREEVLSSIIESATRLRGREHARLPNDLDELNTILLSARKKAQDLHRDLQLLKIRIAGLPASEGILLIKERKRQPGS